MPPPNQENVVPPQVQAGIDYKQGAAASKTLRTKTPSFSIGIISRVIPGSYIMTVATQGAETPEVPCIYVPGMMSFAFGAKDCSLPSEGTPVLMIAMPRDPRTKLAICCLPDQLKGIKISDDMDEIDWVAMFGASAEPGVDYWTSNGEQMQSYEGAGSDKGKSAHIPTNSDRPWNMIPGEWAQGNPMGVFIALFQFMATLKATERAKLECFVFDDLVRLTSGQFQHWNAFGETHIFNDAGQTNIEISGSHYAPETRGYNDYQKAVNPTETHDAMQERVQQKTPDITMKRRFRMFMGGLGDMVQIYLRNMEDADSPSTYSSEEQWGASFKCHLDNSGALNVSSAAGIGMSLNDRIPVPKRNKEAWDQTGDTPEKTDAAKPDPKLHFDYGKDWPWMRNIMAMDSEAWEDGLSYKRFDEKPKDFTVPQPSGLGSIPGKYDNLKSDSRQDDYSKRKAGWKIEQDGSVRIWDNWGSEMYMRGGDMVLSCPGHIIMQPGKGIIGMGNDIVLKAKNSIDITATDKDVRITSGQNIAAYAGSGMLFEADGSGDATYAEGDQGEDVIGGGIVFKARNSNIYLWGQNVTVYASQFIVRATESIVMSAKQLLGVFTDYFLLEVAGSSGITVDDGSAAIFGTSVSVTSGSSVSITQGSQYLVPLKWQPTDTNPYDWLVPEVENTDSNYSDDGDWLGALRPGNQDNIMFTYRTPAQYGTMHGIEVDSPAQTVAVYEPRWQVMLNGGSPGTGGIAIPWQESAVNSTYPWPGAGVRDQAYVSVDGLANVFVAQYLESKDRDKLVGTFKPNIHRSSLDSYIIIPN